MIKYLILLKGEGVKKKHDKIKIDSSLIYNQTKSEMGNKIHYFSSIG